MKRLLAAIGSCMVLLVQAQTVSVRERTEQYINAYKEIAIQEMVRTGVPAAIKLAQGIVESQFGESDLAKESNNHFGIKCKTEWTGARTYHDDDARGECFRVYSSVADSYRDHSDFLRTRPHYAFLFNLDPTDYAAWATGLKKAGYATSNTYPQRLKKIIEDYELNQYSIQGVARMKNGTTNQPLVDNTVATPQPLPITKDTATTIPATNLALTEKVQTQNIVQPESNNETAVDTIQDTNTAVSLPVPDVKPAKNSPYPKGIFTINHTKVIYAEQGISLLALANQYDISLSRLLEFNELPDMDILDTDRLLFIERKQKKGSTDTHIVTTGETLHDICQKEGIRLESLLEYNKLKKDASLSAGQQLYLRVVSPSSVKNEKTAPKKNTK
ncbi:MAG: LysM peptidoglycan-binding domain-containing protein [Chitinophagaceae bacterium]|nr:LysM peptidoglycan-binding domain-containing protein [Chitinophagaceae bacterium]